MTDRIANLATSNLLMSHLYKTQDRLLDWQYQISSQQKSATYSGISKSTQYLMSLEHSRDSLNGFIKNNEIMDVRLDITSTAIDGLQTDVGDFISNLKKFKNQSGKTQLNVATIQSQAFNALSSIEAYLNTPIGSRFAFAGGRVDNAPVDLGLTTLADFQAKYDGDTVKYPTTRDAHIENFEISSDSSGATNWLVFEQDGDGNTATAGTGTITATTAQFANVSVGTTIEVSGTASNDGYYTVTAVNGGGTAIEVETRMLTDEANNAAAEITLSDGTVLNSTDFTDLTFTRATNRIDVGAASSGTNALSDLTVGSAFTISGTAQNDGTYTVESVDGTNGDYVTIVPKKLTDEGTTGTEVDGTIASVHYYSGDELTITHRVDESRSFDYDINGIHPAFEKAIRAMSIIAQGGYGTAGGLDQNLDRAEDAVYLLDSAYNGLVSGDPPYGDEETGNIADILIDISYNKVLISQTTETHTSYKGFLEGQIANIENSDPLEIITRLLDDQRALEAAYQSLARIRELSLANYL